MSRRRSRRNATSDRVGLSTLLLGLIFAVAGGYLLTNQVQVGSGPFGGFAWFGPNSFGLALVPLLIGVGLLAFNAKLLIGRLLTAAGAVILLASVLDTLRITFRPTSLFNTLLMLGLLLVGVGLLARSIVGVGTQEAEDVDAAETGETPQVTVQLSPSATQSLHGVTAQPLPSAARKTVDEELAELHARKAHPKSG